MRLPDDDEVYQIDQTYLGPEGRYIGEFKHKTIFLWLVIVPPIMATLRALGMPGTLLANGAALVVSTWLVLSISDRLTTERTVWHLLATLRAEVVTPRRQSTPDVAPGLRVAELGTAPEHMTRWTRKESAA